MLRQYHELKRQHPGALLFFRLGDFYELFYDDAVTAARELEITLTARHKETPNPVPMCGVPHHSAANHIGRLVRKGYRVAICEQTEDPTNTKKLVRREVVRVITPGTAIDPQLIDDKRPAYLAALCSSNGSAQSYGLALLDLSTGEFRATQIGGEGAWQEALAHIESFAPRELLYPESLAALLTNNFDAPIPALSDGKCKDADDAPPSSDAKSSSVVASLTSPVNMQFASDCAPALTPLDDWLWRAEDSERLLCDQLRVQRLDGYRLTDKPEAVRAAAVCLRYARETQRLDTNHITDISVFETRNCLVLDAVTLRNLEVVESQSERNAARTLLGVIDETVTGMGARLLRSWLLRPSINLPELIVRQDSIEELFRSHIKRDSVRAALKQIADLERLTGRLSMNTATPRELIVLKRSLETLPALKRSLADSTSSLLCVLAENLDELADVRDRIAETIDDDAPANISEGGAIRTGFSTELDELRSISRDAKTTIAALERRERMRTGIATLRVRHNNVFGYFIEVNRSVAARVPPDYERRQTIANAERFTTPELKQHEASVAGADERITELEGAIFAGVRSEIAAEVKRLQGVARALATLDVLACFAEVAVRRRYVRPVLHEGDELEIKNGRHPVIEAFAGRPFVANDLLMNNSTHRLIVITGPNMGGKSTILRQTALIAVLAQTGSFVPASSACLPLFDRVWTRVGASDDLAGGRSTFMVEMTETSAIVRGATPRSLVLLDEVGRGTATFDGLSLAWAIAEHLHDSPQHAAKTLFATHYHELTELAARLAGAKNFRIRVAETDSGVTFLHQLEEGAASKSYGIEVARLAGVPPEILIRAREVLSKLERIDFEILADDEATERTAPLVTEASQATRSASPNDQMTATLRRANRGKLAAQITFFQAANADLLEQVRGVDVETLPPEEMRRMLRDLQTKML